MAICSVCENEFEDKYFDTDQQKCILHCDKDDWYEIQEYEKKWSKSIDKIELFWQQVRKKIQHRDSAYFIQGHSLDFSKTIFPKFEDQYTEEDQFSDETIHIIDWHDNFCNPNITNSQTPSFDLEARIDFYGSVFLDDAKFIYYNFKEHVSFNNVEFKGVCTFYNTTFSSVTFNNVNFFKSVRFDNSKVNLLSYHSGDFENTIFHDNAEFYECVFGTEDSKKDFDIDFRGTKFKKISFTSCNYKKGLRFYKDTKTNHLDIQNINIPELYIAGDIKNIHIRGNNKKIDKLTIKHLNLENLLIHNCIVGSDFLLNDKLWKKDEIFGIKNLNFSESTFQGKVKIQFYEITGAASFYNTKFKDLADFYRTKFNKVVFERTDFEKVAVFSEAVFNQDVNFKYAKFLGYSVFRDTVIKGKLDLRNTIFDTDADANFLDITSEERKRDTETKEFYGDPKVIQVANRETARIIKSFYEYTNNIIEANKFYALEMQEREKELKKVNNISDWLIFKIHAITSDHSQSWFLTLLWIFIVSVLYSTYCLEHINLLAGPVAVCILPLIIILYTDQNKNNKYVVSFLFLMLLLLNYFMIIKTPFIRLLDTIADKLNPFSIMTSKDPMTFGLLIFKITIAYLFYQFIISVRQNTRRK